MSMPLPWSEVMMVMEWPAVVKVAGRPSTDIEEGLLERPFT